MGSLRLILVVITGLVFVSVQGYGVITVVKTPGELKAALEKAKQKTQQEEVEKQQKIKEEKQKAAAEKREAGRLGLSRAVNTIESTKNNTFSAGSAVDVAARSLVDDTGTNIAKTSLKVLVANSYGLTDKNQENPLPPIDKYKSAIAAITDHSKYLQIGFGKLPPPAQTAIGNANAATTNQQKLDELYKGLDPVKKAPAIEFMTASSDSIGQMFLKLSHPVTKKKEGSSDEAEKERPIKLKTDATPTGTHVGTDATPEVHESDKETPAYVPPTFVIAAQKAQEFAGRMQQIADDALQTLEKDEKEIDKEADKKIADIEKDKKDEPQILVIMPQQPPGSSGSGGSGGGSGGGGAGGGSGGMGNAGAVMTGAVLPSADTSGGGPGYAGSGEGGNKRGLNFEMPKAHPPVLAKLDFAKGISSTRGPSELVAVAKGFELTGSGAPLSSAKNDSFGGNGGGGAGAAPSSIGGIGGKPSGADSIFGGDPFGGLAPVPMADTESKSSQTGAGYGGTQEVASYDAGGGGSSGSVVPDGVLPVYLNKNVRNASEASEDNQRPTLVNTKVGKLVRFACDQFQGEMTLCRQLAPRKPPSSTRTASLR